MNKKIPLRRALASSLFLLLTCSLQAAIAQDAAQPVVLIAPGPMVSRIDIFARVLGGTIMNQTGQKFTFQDMDTDDGTMAADFVAKSAPDGHTLLLGNDATQATNVHFAKNFPYDPATEFTPIAIFFEESYVLVARPDVPAANIAELVAHMKSAKVKLAFASIRPSTTGRLAAAAFTGMAGGEASYMDFMKATDAADAIKSGKVQLMFVPLQLANNPMLAGKVKILGVADPQRLPAFPELPAIGETMPGFAISGWYGLFGPAKMAPELQKAWNAKVNAVLADPKIASAFSDPKQGRTAVPRTPEDLAALVKRDLAAREKLAKAAGSLQ